MNGFDIVFTDEGQTTYGNNELGIGTSNPQAKLHVVLNENISTNVVTHSARLSNAATSPSGKGLLVNMSNHTSSSFGVESNIDALNNTTSNNQGFRTLVEGGAVNEGVHIAVKNGTVGNTGVFAVATSSGSGANIATGIRGDAFDGVNSNRGGDFRALSPAGNTNNNMGVYALSATTGVNNYGIYAQVSGSGGGNNFAGYFNGDVYVQGNITASGQITPSDSMLKTNIDNISNPLSLINALQPRVFHYDTVAYDHFSFDSGQKMGLIAQEVEQVIPTIVTNRVMPAQYDTLGVLTSPEVSFKGVEYKELIPLLIAGMQEQQALISSKDSMINNLNDRLTQLENCLSNILPALCQINNSAIYQNDDQSQSELIHTLNLELFDGENIVLEQNIPNPFAERTVINYYLPESVRDAKIIFYSQEGRMINEMNITERGNGRVNVYGADLSKGIYSYTLICDGQVIATKKMVKQ